MRLDSKCHAKFLSGLKIPISTLLLLSAVTMLSAKGVRAEGWVSPASGNDAENLWVDIPNAIDGNTATYASDQSNRSGDGSVLELQMAAPILCGRLRVNADFGYSADGVRISVLRDNVWSEIFSGPINDGAYTEITFDPGQVSAVRYVYHYTSSGYYLWLYDLSLFESAAVINPPAVSTL